MYVSLPTQWQALYARCIGFILNMFQVFLSAFQDDLVDEGCVLLWLILEFFSGFFFP